MYISCSRCFEGYNPMEGHDCKNEPALPAPVPKPRFGDTIENGWASTDNPTRVGIFVREGYRTGRMNRGRYFEVTNGEGKFWELMVDRDHKITVTRDSAPGVLAALHGLVDWLEDNKRTIDGEFSMDELLAGPRAAIAKAEAVA
jgi:hypothetical protein